MKDNHEAKPCCCKEQQNEELAGMVANVMALTMAAFLKTQTAESGNSKKGNCANKCNVHVCAQNTNKFKAAFTDFSETEICKKACEKVFTEYCLCESNDEERKSVRSASNAILNEKTNGDLADADQQTDIKEFIDREIQNIQDNIENSTQCACMETKSESNVTDTFETKDAEVQVDIEPDTADKGEKCVQFEKELCDPDCKGICNTDADTMTQQDLQDTENQTTDDLLEITVEQQVEEVYYPEDQDDDQSECSCDNSSENMSVEKISWADRIALAERRMAYLQARMMNLDQTLSERAPPTKRVYYRCTNRPTQIRNLPQPAIRQNMENPCRQPRPCSPREPEQHMRQQRPQSPVQHGSPSSSQQPVVPCSFGTCKQSYQDNALPSRTLAAPNQLTATCPEKCSVVIKVPCPAKQSAEGSGRPSPVRVPSPTKRSPPGGKAAPTPKNNNDILSSKTENLRNPESPKPKEGDSKKVNCPCPKQAKTGNPKSTIKKQNVQ